MKYILVYKKYNPELDKYVQVEEGLELVRKDFYAYVGQLVLDNFYNLKDVAYAEWGEEEA